MEQTDMTISLWVSILVAAIAGISAAVIAPLVTAKLTQTHWKRQIDFQKQEKSFQLKYEAFLSAIDTLAVWAADALNPDLQSSKASYKGMSQHVAFRPETAQSIERSRGLVGALFSKDIQDKFEVALRTTISIENAPNVEFEQMRRDFVVSAARELGLSTGADA